MNGYNLIVKANTTDEAIQHVNEVLSIPATSASPLGYGEVIVSVHADRDLTTPLNEWLIATRPGDDAPFPPGALIHWS